MIVKKAFSAARKIGYTLPAFRNMSSRTKRKILHTVTGPIIALHTRKSKPVQINSLSLHIPPNLLYTYLFQEYELETQKIFREFIKSNMIVLDVGANIGYLSLIAAQLVGPQGKVYSVEPGPDNLEYLQKNVTDNALSNVEILPYAAGAMHRLRHFYLRDISTTHSFYAPTKPSDARSIEVQEIPLDEVVKERVDFIKLDVEGEEIEALKGMRQILESNKKIQLLVEWSPKLLQRAGYSPSELPKWLRQEGFHLSVLSVHNGKPQLSSEVDPIIAMLQAGDEKALQVTNLFAQRP